MLLLSPICFIAFAEICTTKHHKVTRSTETWTTPYIGDSFIARYKRCRNTETRNVWNAEKFCSNSYRNPIGFPFPCIPLIASYPSSDIGWHLSVKSPTQILPIFYRKVLNGSEDSNIRPRTIMDWLWRTKFRGQLTNVMERFADRSVETGNSLVNGNFPETAENEFVSPKF